MNKTIPNNTTISCKDLQWLETGTKVESLIESNTLVTGLIYHNDINYKSILAFQKCFESYRIENDLLTIFCNDYTINENIENSYIHSLGSASDKVSLFHKYVSSELFFENLEIYIIKKFDGKIIFPIFEIDSFNPIISDYGVRSKIEFKYNKIIKHYIIPKGLEIYIL